MPLDVQPLSPTRRIIMLLVLVALLGASVGFARFLVGRSHAALTIAWNFPPNFKTLPLDSEEPEEVVIRAQATIHGHKRFLRGIVIDFPGELTAEEHLRVLHALFESLSDASPGHASPAPLAGRPGMEIEGISDSGEFTIVRMIAIPDRAIAICYSGSGKLTDWDKLYFNNVCQRVSLDAAPTTHRK
jgi:hypothetical protein